MGSKFTIPKKTLLWAKLVVAILLVAMLIHRISLKEITAYMMTRIGG